jgi:hypothetical protein
MGEIRGRVVHETVYLKDLAGDTQDTEDSGGCGFGEGINI